MDVSQKHSEGEPMQSETEEEEQEVIVLRNVFTKT
jgi:hypothetical protein